MAIEIRSDNTGMATMIVLACLHCSEDIADPADGVAVWVLGGESDPVTGTVLIADFAHRGCEERFQEEHLGPEQRDVARDANVPLVELFDMLRQPFSGGREDENDGQA